ncbi:ABC transporter ATP-binding protein [Dethiobacter alkaliphilus]|uniref:ABC transporter related protein n=1 Tax=Dethiobacter alkaliphilus AHT 1 TaxID=555088 RepID=C0GJ53_DETAL|nr:phosphate ABC transporter ATP-binding protein [Dethiobacter alkaliphilus]EEG76686.1 ABC transporter related protein [Dethiobacter alkaliphilus AHT 1]
MNKTSIITVKNLTKRYNKKEVLCISELNALHGRILGLIGPSGAGKSTLLRILNMLEEPTTGEVSYLQQPAPVSQTGKLQLRRKMTMVFQKAALLDTSVYNNVAFGLQARKVPKQEIRERVLAMLDDIGMLALSQQRAKTLSGGEAQRIAFARALVLQPEILFLDEPTANLDPPNVELLEGMIARLNQDHGTTILFVTHNLFQARRLCHDTAFFYQGKLIETRETEQLFTSSQKEQTRAFVEGKMIY